MKLLKTELSNQSEAFIIFIASLGGALEMYDFIIYISFSKIISELFFITTNHFLSLVFTLGIFAAGYLSRPIGGLVFGHFGDKYGRKRTFSFSIMLMAVPTFLIGFLPTYQTIGILAPLLLLLLRILQGISLGGELPGGLIFTVEHMPKNRKGFASACIFAAIGLSMALGSAISGIAFKYLTQDQLFQFGWRIVFILGGFIGLISYFLRAKLTESPVFLKVKHSNMLTQYPLYDIYKFYRKNIIKGFGLVWLSAVIVCVIYLYLPIYLSQNFDYSLVVLAPLQTINLILYSILIVFFGYLSDYIGRKKLLIIGSCGFLFCSLIIFNLFYHDHIYDVLLAMIGLSVMSGMIMGCFSYEMLDLFPAQVRYSGFSLSYNLGFAFLGGLSPLLITLMTKFATPIAPAFYLMFSASICLLTILFIK